MPHTPTQETANPPSVLARLRTLLPDQRLHFSEARRIAELQANKLLQLTGVHGVPVPVEAITSQPRITVEHDPDLPAHAVTGSSNWNAQHRNWVISLNPSQPPRRQRFTIFHEFKHILDHGSHTLATDEPAAPFTRPLAEHLADYFASCVLMPKRLLKAAHHGGIQRVTDLAELFDVPEETIRARLRHLGLSDEPSSRPAPTRARPHTLPRASWPSLHDRSAPVRQRNHTMEATR